MKNFKLRDFDGAGQYLVRTEKSHIDRTGFLSTIMVKIGYMKGLKSSGRNGDRYCLISMSDGWVNDGKIIVEDNDNRNFVAFETDEFVSGKQKLVNYLNHPNTSNYRFATQEEVVRVVLYQKNRWVNE